MRSGRSGTIWPRGIELPHETPTGRLSTREVFPPRVALARGRRAIGVAGVALAAFALLFTIVKRQRSDFVDRRVTVALQRNQQPWLRRSMQAVSWPGFAPASAVIPAGLVGVWLAFGFPLEAAFQLAGWGTSLISFSVKRAMRRPRPHPEHVRVSPARLGDTSFPSGHVLNYVGIYGSFGYLAATLIRPDRVRRPLVALCAGLIALVGPSRIYLGHHWLTDVTASYLLGLSYLLGTTALYRRAKIRLLGSFKSDPARIARES